MLVERPVNRTEFPEYAAFDPYEAGAPRASDPGLHESQPALFLKAVTVVLAVV